jgi:hypothetical protein
VVTLAEVQLASVAEQQLSARLILDVDEPGRDDHVSRIDSRPCGRRPQHPPRHHARDAISANGDIAVEPGRAGPVHDAPILDHNVVR